METTSQERAEIVEKRLLSSGSVLLCDDRRVAIDLLSVTSHDDDNNHKRKNNANGWTTLSSAVLNGGLSVFPPPSPPPAAAAGTTRSSSGRIHVLNAKVPADYDGVTPNPKEWLQSLAKKEGFDPDCTVGLLTAASMYTLRIASRSAEDVYVDAIVTAGLSNSRAVGVDADLFHFGDANNHDNLSNNNNNSNKKQDSSTDSSPIPPPGTINTIVITSATLTPSALVEAYSIAIEAKCAACAQVGVVCAKSGQLAQGTGTDTTVIATPNNNNDNDDKGNHVVIEYAGKHTLFAELVGQAVLEATREALLCNIHYKHRGNLMFYTLYGQMRRLRRIIMVGARPCVPPRPMMPLPSAPMSVMAVGAVMVGSIEYLSPLLSLPRKTRVLLAAVVWDRYLCGPPLAVHPVVLVGKMISAVLRQMPDKVFVNPTLGLLCGTLLLLGVLAISLSTARCILAVAALASENLVEVSTFKIVTNFAVWLLEVVLVKSTLSLQLLCTVALQMAKYLERRQVPEARIQLSWLCSRDSSTLDMHELAGATLESLAENLSDGFVAPVMWYMAFGPLGALGYRVINTLDSRVGYRDKFEWFGKPSARLDDLVNWIPARMTAYLLAVAAIVLPGCDAANAVLVAWKDSSQCKSPNAGWPMGAMAGLLHVQLEKKREYELGSGTGSALPEPASIRTGQKVAQLAGGLMVLLAAAAPSFFP